MNEAIQAALAPLAAFWIALDGVIKMTKFVNDMRETIIFGVRDKAELSLHHRQAMFVDWKLSMVSFVGATFFFSGIVFSLADIVPKASIGIYGVSLSVLLGSVLFTICGVSDYRAIKLALNTPSERKIV